MMDVDVLLIFPQIRSWDKPRNFPTGIGIIASVIRNAGYSVAVIDAHGEMMKEVVDIVPRLEQYNPKLIGIGGLITTYGWTKRAIRIIREIFSNVPIMWGGGCASSIPEVCLEKNEVDYLYQGEADYMVGVSLFFHRPECRLLLECPETENLNALPFPAWDLFPMENYMKYPVVGYGRDYSIITSRGCPFKCTYCYQLFGHKPRYRSAANVVEEIRQVRDKYGLDYVSIQDDCFITNKPRVYEFCDLIKPMGLKWSCCGRVNLAERELYKRMKDAGCDSINYGIESGSQTIVYNLRKGVSIEQDRAAITMNREVGLRCPTSFMIGSPGETRETALETLAFVKEMDIPLQSMMFTTPYPGTTLFEWAQARGIIGRSIDEVEEYVLKLSDATKFVVNLTDMEDKELIELREEIIDNAPKPRVEPADRHKREHGFNE